MARPSNQWFMVRLPTSHFAGPVRISDPRSQAGSSPSTGRPSTWVSCRVTGSRRGRQWRSPGGVVALMTVPLVIVRFVPFGPYFMIPAVSTPRLSETSYAVLALVALLEPATPYQLKRVAQVSILHFWSIPHTQLYTECARLAEAGSARRAAGEDRPPAPRLPAQPRPASRSSTPGAPTRSPTFTSSATPGCSSCSAAPTRPPLPRAQLGLAPRAPERLRGDGRRGRNDRGDAARA